MRPRLDCLEYEVLDPEKHLRKVTNREFLDVLRGTIWGEISEDQRQLFEKLLTSERSRFVAVDDLIELFEDNHESRYRRYKERLEHYTKYCVASMMSRVDIPLDSIRLVITNTTVAGVCPPLSSVIANQLGLKATTQAIDLGYMGCSAAIWAGELAARLLKAGEVAILFSAELTSAMTNFRGATESLTASCVFGDGVGAFLVAAPPHQFAPRFRVRDFSGSLICTDQALECIRYEPNPVFHEIRLQDFIPEVAARGIDTTLRPLIRRNVVSMKQKISFLISRVIPKWQDNVDYVVLHAAGNKILRGIQENLGLSDRQVGHNFHAFAKYGNTSSTSIYYSLRELDSTQHLVKGDRILFLAFGSGFMTKGMFATVARGLDSRLPRS